MIQNRWMYLAYFTQGLILLNIFYAVSQGNGTQVMMGLIMFGLGMISYCVTRITKIEFPWFVYFLISLALLIHTSGYIQERYINIPNWDTLAHSVSGSIVALLGFILIMFLDKSRNYNLDPPFIAGFSLMFAMTMEYLWEIYEFLVDTFLGGSLAGKMQLDNTDTMMDMIFVFGPSVIVALGCLYYLNKFGKERIMNDMIKNSLWYKNRLDKSE